MAARTSASSGLTSRTRFWSVLEGGDLEQGDDLAGRGQAVLDQGVVTGLQHLLDAGAGVSQELHRCPGPESAVLGEVEVQERPGRVAGAGAAVLGADEDGAADGEGRARRHGVQGFQTSQAVAVVVGRGLGEGFQGRETFAGALVHAGFDPLGALGVQGLRP
nr:hypothetical protein OH837_00685 [Streptomyces canus]